MERTSMDIKEEIVIIWFLRSKCKKTKQNKTTVHCILKLSLF